MNIADVLNPKDVAVRGRPIWDGKWRYTECIGCPAAPLHIAMGCPGSEGIFPKETQALFYEGNLHERDMKERARDAGEIIIDFPNGVHALDIPVVGHPDGYSHTRQGINEYKSSYDADDPEDFVDEHPNYVKQLMGYERILNVPVGWLIVKNRNTGWIIPDIEIHHDSKVTDPIWANITRVANILATNPTSCQGPWFPECSRDFRDRMFCPFNGVHCHTSEAVASSQMEALMTEYAANKSVSDDLYATVQKLRGQIGQIMADAGMKRAKNSQGVSASVYTRHFTAANRELAKELLTKDLYDQIFTTGEAETLRITLPRGM